MTITVHDPCRNCGRDVAHDGSTKFPLCDDCKYDERFQRVKKLLEHSLSHCTDPDCEIHNPWVQEDEAERVYAMAYFFAGAQAFAEYLGETVVNEYLARIQDEMNAPEHPAGA